MDVHKPLRLFQVSRGIFFFDRCLVTDPWPQRTGCDNWSWPRWHWSPRTGAHAFLSWPMKQAYHSNTQKKRFPEPTVKSFEKDSVQVWKRIQITLITLACDCCRLKGIWDMSGSKWSLYGTYILYSHVSGCIHQFNCLICLWICVCVNVCVCTHR